MLDTALQRRLDQLGLILVDPSVLKRLEERLDTLWKGPTQILYQNQVSAVSTPPGYARGQRINPILNVERYPSVAFHLTGGFTSGGVLVTCTLQVQASDDPQGTFINIPDGRGLQQNVVAPFSFECTIGKPFVFVQISSLSGTIGSQAAGYSITATPFVGGSTGGRSGVFVNPLSVTVTTTPQALPSQVCAALELQNDPSSAQAILHGDANRQTVSLAVGQTKGIAGVANANSVYVKTASGTAILNYSVLY